MSSRYKKLERITHDVPHLAMSTINEPDSIVATWLSAFVHGVQSGDPQAIANTFLPNGWLKDVLTFTWDTRAFRGRDAVARYLADSDRLSQAAVTNIVLETDPHFTPRFSSDVKDEVEAGFRYETRCALGRGYVHLRQDEDGAWRAQTLGMIILDIKGHEEVENIAGDWEADGRTWGAQEAERKAKIEADPYVLIGMSTAISHSGDLV